MNKHGCCKSNLIIFYQVKFSFGSQKWKTKCRVRKQPAIMGPPSAYTSSSQGTVQEWTSTTGMFYPVIGGQFIIKVKSVRGVLKLQSDLGQIVMYTDTMYGHEETTETVCELKFENSGSFIQGSPLKKETSFFNPKENIVVRVTLLLFLEKSAFFRFSFSLIAQIFSYRGIDFSIHFD